MNPVKFLIFITILLVLGIVLFASYISAQTTYRDAKRVSDISQLQKALNIYRQEYGQYPQGSNGMAVGIDNAFYRFIDKWPTGPEGGICTERNSAYKYEQINGGKSYSLSFCLEKSYNNAGPGVRSVSAPSQE